MKFTKTLTAAAIIAAGFALNAQAADKMKIAMVVKTLGNGFFDAAHQGADEAALAGRTLDAGNDFGIELFRRHGAGNQRVGAKAFFGDLVDEAVRRP